MTIVNKINTIHIGNADDKKITSSTIIEKFATELIPIFNVLNIKVCFVFTHKYDFTYTSKRLALYKKIWGNHIFNNLKKFNHTMEEIVYESNDNITFMSIVEIPLSEIVIVYEMLVRYNKNKFLIIVPSHFNIIDYTNKIAQILAEHQKDGVIDVRLLFYDIINVSNNIIFSSTWGFADDSDCGIGLYSNKNNIIFNELSNAIQNKFMNNLNIIIDSDSCLYL